MRNNVHASRRQTEYPKAAYKPGSRISATQKLAALRVSATAWHQPIEAGTAPPSNAAKLSTQQLQHAMRSTGVGVTLDPAQSLFKRRPLSCQNLLDLMAELQGVGWAEAANRFEGTKGMNPRGHHRQTRKKILEKFLLLQKNGSE